MPFVLFAIALLAGGAAAATWYGAKPPKGEPEPPPGHQWPEPVLPPPPEIVTNPSSSQFMDRQIHDDEMMELQLKLLRLGYLPSTYQVALYPDSGPNSALSHAIERFFHDYPMMATMRYENYYKYLPYWIVSGQYVNVFGEHGPEVPEEQA